MRKASPGIAGEMRTAGALLMIFIGVVQGTYQMETTCDMEIETPCYGTLGQTVYLQLSKYSEGLDIYLFNRTASIFRFRKSKPSETPERWLFIRENGTMRISRAQKNDSGFYRAELYTATGRRMLESKTLLTIEAPVDTPVLTDLCEEQFRTVKCSSSGDSPQYSWFLDGRLLRETETVSSADKETLRLRGNVTGELKCTVRNNVSSENSTKQLKSCYETQTAPVTDSKAKTESTSPPSSLGGVIIEDKTQWIYYIVIPVSGFLLVLICLTVTICVCRKRHTQSTRTPTTADNYSDCSE